MDIRAVSFNGSDCCRSFFCCRDLNCCTNQTMNDLSLVAATQLGALHSVLDMESNARLQISADPCDGQPHARIRTKLLQFKVLSCSVALGSKVEVKSAISQDCECVYLVDANKIRR